MSFQNIVSICRGEGLKIEPRDQMMNQLGVHLRFIVRKSRPAIVGLMQGTDAGVVFHVVLCRGWQANGTQSDGSYVFLDRLATSLSELPEKSFPQYVTSYGPTWSFVGQSITVISPSELDRLA